VAPISILSAPICSISPQAARFDCFPGNGASQAACEARGCCWNAGNREKLGADQLQIGVPSCFFPSNYPSYNITSLQVCKQYLVRSNIILSWFGNSNNNFQGSLTLKPRAQGLSHFISELIFVILFSIIFLLSMFTF